MAMGLAAADAALRVVEPAALELLTRVRNRDPGLDMEWVLAQLETGRARFLPCGPRSGYVVFAHDDEATIYAVAGDMPDVLVNEPQLCRFLAEHGCKRVRGYGRKGWIRVLKPLGWRRDGDSVVKELT